MKAISSAVVIILFLILGLFIAGFPFPVQEDKTIELIPGSQRDSSVIIKNSGITPLWFSELMVTVNGQAAEILNTRARANPGESKILFFRSPLFGDNLNVTITAPSNTISYIITISSSSLEASCSDGIQNQDETDVDCGGDICGTCGNGFACLTNSDCVSQNCISSVCTSTTGTETCTDGMQNQDETDTDCGGSCPACAAGQACIQHSDCLSNSCISGICESSLLSCTDLGGIVCSANETCNGTLEQSTEGNCCLGTCEPSLDCTDDDGDNYYAQENCGTPQDCDDSDPGINPGAEEICDDIDNNCENGIDEGCYVCGNGICEPRETPENCPEDCGQYILTYYADMFDVEGLLDEENWSNYVNTMVQLRDMGYTHAGIRIWGAHTDPPLINQRISELRGYGLDLAILHGPGDRYLIRITPEDMDSQNHTSNGQNLKYFDAPGFDPHNCSSTFLNGWCERHEDNGPHCQDFPDWTAHDPAYDGEIWQNETNVTKGIIEIINPTADDIVLYDLEVWGTNESFFEGCYPGAIANSVDRYSGTLEERYQQYWDYWKDRGLDLKQIVKDNNDSFTLFYNENIPSLEKVYTSMPAGSGDAPSPHMYSLPYLNVLQSRLDQGDFSGSYVWINIQVRYGTPDMENWDTKITQKAGYMFREEGVAGVIIWPAPTSRYGPSVFLSHAQALVDGFVRGIDPGELIEQCWDGMDNDGDGEIDEGCVFDCAENPPAQIISWHHSWGQDLSNLVDLAATNFVTHIVISNLDFNEQPNSGVAYKIQGIRDADLVPVWERDLWFQDGNTSSQGFAQQFLDNYTDGSILYSADYYEWFLNNLHQEAEELGVPLVAIDSEPYGNHTEVLAIKEILINGSEISYNRIQQAVQEALSREGVKQAHYIYPTGTFPESYYPYSGYKALTELGKNKISENTYFDCPYNILEESLGQDLQLIGIWATITEECYRWDDESCYIGDDENYTCFLTDSDHDGVGTALWGPYAIFNNVEYWYDIDRGLFIYTWSYDHELFPQTVIDFCQNNSELCGQYSYRDLYFEICDEIDNDCDGEIDEGC